MGKQSEPTYAPQMSRPFWTVLRRYPQVPSSLLDELESAPQEERVPVALGQSFLKAMVEQTGEENLGLLAALETTRGTFEVLEFAAYSAPTWRDAIETGFRYVRLMNQAADFRLELVGDRAHLKLHSSVPLTRAGIDFQSATFHLSGSRWFAESPPDLEVWLTYPEPADVSEHRRIYGAAKLRFEAPWNGFVHDVALLDTELVSADPSLHRVLREHVEGMLAELAPAGGVVAQVRAQLIASMNGRPVSAADVAGRMDISRRTLTRRLGQQGTSFKALLDGVRRQAALRYLSTGGHSVDDIAFLLGFSESSAFVRAFKRWEGIAPAAYRNARNSS